MIFKLAGTLFLILSLIINLNAYAGPITNTDETADNKTAIEKAKVATSNPAIEKTEETKAEQSEVKTSEIAKKEISADETDKVSEKKLEPAMKTKTQEKAIEKQPQVKTTTSEKKPKKDIGQKTAVTSNDMDTLKATTTKDNSSSSWMTLFFAFIALLMLGLTIFTMILTRKVYSNAKTIDTPSNLIEKFDELIKSVDNNKSIVEKLIGRVNLLEKNIASDIYKEIELTNNIITNELNHNFQSLSSFSKGVADRLGDVTNKIAELDGVLKALRDFSSTNLQEKKRYQDGYDWSITKNFCNSIIRLIDSIETDISNTDEIDDDHPLAIIKEELLIILEGNNIEQFMVESEQPFRGNEKLCKPIPVKTEYEQHNGLIGETLKPGYYYLSDDNNQRVIRPAEVEVYKFIESDT